MPQQVYDILIQEHRQVEQMLNQMTQGQADQQQIQQLYTALEAHTQGEEQTLYQDLLQERETHELIVEAIEEHHVADLILRELKDIDPSDERCSAKLQVLKENVMHHVQEEEQKLFPMARQVMDGQWAEEVGQEYEEKEQQLKQRMQ